MISREKIQDTDEKRKLYVGCGLTHAPQTFRDSVEQLKEVLANEWKVMQFLGTSAGTAADVYEMDILTNVHGCDAFLGIVDMPSTGLGWEANEAIRLGKPALLVAHAATTVTRLVLGATHFTDLRFARYNNMVQDVPAIVRATFAGV
jgi:hypothetical protein